MIKAYRLFTGPGGDSHVERGRISPDALVEAESVQFSETAAHSSLSLHNVSVPQYVLTLAGILEFTARSGDAFTIYPGDVLLVTDNTGTGHEWRLVNDEPWLRVHVVVKPDADTHFVAQTLWA
jgi:quercetin dioxygenase-like cupin family protein